MIFMSMYDYQRGYCHYFADIIISEIRKLLPNHKINYLLLLGERFDDNDENIDDVLIHAYIKVGHWLLDSKGFHPMSESESRLSQWEETEKRNTPEGYRFETDIEETNKIPEYFFNSQFCNKSIIKKDIKDFLDSDVFNEFLEKIRNKKVTK